MTDVYREYTDKKQYCAIGSVKTNVGHSLCASGMASVIKVLLMLEHKSIPPTLHCEPMHPRFHFEQSPFYPNTKLAQWDTPTNSGRKKAAIASFGFGGTNAHIIVEEYPLAVEWAQKPKRATQFNRKRYWVYDQEETDSIKTISLNLGTKDSIQSIAFTTEKTDSTLTDMIKNIISNMLSIRTEEVDDHTNFMEMGLDSSNIVQLSSKLEETLSIELYPTLLFEYKNIQELSVYLENNFTIQIAGKEDQMDAYDERDIDEKLTNSNNNDIAIIGVSCKFPGSNNKDEFFQNLMDNKTHISEIPQDRFDWHEIYGNIDEPNKTNSKWGGFISNIYEFDPLFFSISPREAEQMDPQHRLVLMSVQEAFQDAGFTKDQLRDTKTGVYIGISSYDYFHMMNKFDLPMESTSVIGNAHTMLPNRISYIYDLHGPSVSIDTACSSALVSIHQAASAIEKGEINMAVVGGVNALLSSELFISFGKAGMLSPDGLCKTFDKDANGYVRGEGVGVVILKSLSLAKKDNDNIYCVIKGTAVNHGGHSSSLTAPNSNAQAAVISEALHTAHVNINTLSYIEAHGTGTSLGDPIEIEGIKKVFENSPIPLSHEKIQNCAIGSVKSNIGHLEAAAGIAGLIKVIMAMKHKYLPATLNFSELNPYINLDNTPVYVIRENKAWEKLTDEFGNKINRRAGISSFGFGGTNAHIILEEYEKKQKIKSFDENEQLETEPYLIVLSAYNEERLKAYAIKLKVYMKDNSNVDANKLRDIAYTLQVGRDELEERVAFVINSKGALINAINNFINLDFLPDIYRGNYKNDKERHNPIYQRYSETIMDDVFKARKTDKTKKRMSELAELWVKGLAVDWNLLYQHLSEEEKPNRICLPTYPLETEKYFLEKTNPISNKLDYNTSRLAATENTIDALKELFSNYLKIDLDNIDVDKSWMEYGVDSIMTMKLLKQVEKKYSIEIDPALFINNPTISYLGKMLNTKLLSKISVVNQDDMYQLSDPFTNNIYPLSFPQKRMFILHHALENKLIYNMPIALLLYGELSLDKLRDAFRTVIDRHDVFRTSFHFSKQKKQVEQSINNDIYFDIDVINTTEQQLGSLLQDSIKPFDLKLAPLIRVKVFVLLSEKNVLFVDIPHIISDGYSINLLFQEISRLYSNNKLEATVVQYRHFVQREQKMIKDKRFLIAKEYWTKKLEGIKPINLKTDMKRPLIKRYNGDVIYSVISSEIVEGMKKIARESESTMFVVLESIFNLMLYIHTKQASIISGMIVNGRHISGDLDFFDCMGVFINYLPLVININSEMSLLDLISQAKTVISELLNYQAYPFEKILEDINLKNDLSRNPLFDVMLNYHNELSEDSFSIPGVLTEIYKINKKSSRVDFVFDLFMLKSGCMDLWLEYDTDLFHRNTIMSIIEDFVTISKIIINNYNIPIGSITLKNNLVENSDVLNILISIYSDILGVDSKEIDINENQFEMGGNSMLAIEVVSAVSEKIKNITINELFMNPTIKRLSAYLNDEIKVEKNNRNYNDPVQEPKHEDDLIMSQNDRVRKIMDI